MCAVVGEIEKERVSVGQERTWLPAAPPSTAGPATAPRVSVDEGTDGRRQDNLQAGMRD